MHLKPPGGNYLEVIHLKLQRKHIKSATVGENLRNYLPETAKNALKITLWELFKVIHLKLQKMHIKSNMVGENFRNYLPEIV